MDWWKDEKGAVPVFLTKIINWHGFEWNEGGLKFFGYYRAWDDGADGPIHARGKYLTRYTPIVMRSISRTINAAISMMADITRH